MSDAEHILVVEREQIPRAWLPEFGFVPITREQLTGKIKHWPLTFLPRAQAEEDTRYKQIIPYLVLRADSGAVLCYKRQGNERRLHDLYSAGIGGHVNEHQDKADTFWDTVQRGLLRELTEETALQIPPDSVRFCGIINEEKTKVGRVHLGLVFLWEFNGVQKDEMKVSAELKEYDFCSISDFLNNKKYEYWSGLALRLVQQGE